MIAPAPEGLKGSAGRYAREPAGAAPDAQTLRHAGSFEHTNVFQVAVLLGIIQAVAYDKFIRNLKAHIGDFDRAQPAIRLVQQRGDAHGSWLALLQNIDQVSERH